MGAGGPSMNGIIDPSNDNPPWRAGANPFSGHGYYNPFVGWFGWGGGTADAGGGVPGGGGPNRSSPYSSALTPPAVRPTLPQKRPPLWDDPNHIPGPGKYSTANEPDQPAAKQPGSQIDPGQPAAALSSDTSDIDGAAGGGGGIGVDFADDALTDVQAGADTPSNGTSAAAQRDGTAVAPPVKSKVSPASPSAFQPRSWPALKWVEGYRPGHKRGGNRESEPGSGRLGGHLGERAQR